MESQQNFWNLRNLIRIFGLSSKSLESFQNISSRQKIELLTPCNRAHKKDLSRISHEGRFTQSRNFIVIFTYKGPFIKYVRIGRERGRCYFVRFFSWEVFFVSRRMQREGGSEILIFLRTYLMNGPQSRNKRGSFTQSRTPIRVIRLPHFFQKIIKLSSSIFSPIQFMI